MYSNIKLAKTTKIQDDSKLYPIVEITYLSKIANVANCESYGTHSSPPINTPCILLVINNDEANRFIIPLSAYTRKRNLKEGEFECGNFKIGSTIKFDENGNIFIDAVNDINITANGGDINVIGNIHVTGGIDATGDIVAGTISLKTHIHGGVEPGGGVSGQPVP